MSDIFQNHLDNVVNKSWNFAGRIESDQGHEQNALIGLAAEAGEALDQGKKLWFHTPTDRRDKIKSELGDVIFYWLKACDVFGFTFEEVIADNRKKLESRHPELGVVTQRYGPEAIR